MKEYWIFSVSQSGVDLQESKSTEIELAGVVYAALASLSGMFSGASVNCCDCWFLKLNC